MDKQESEQFTTELLIAFPAFKAAAEKHSPDFDRTKKAWWHAWSDLTITECRAVLKSMLLEGGLTFEALQQPGPFIRRLVVESRRGNARSEADEAARLELTGRLLQKQQRQKDYKGSPLSLVFQQVPLMRQRGASEQEIESYIESAFPIEPAYDQPRYRCSACCDTLHVQVWKSFVIQQVRSGTLDINALHHRHTWPIACLCDESQYRNDKLKIPLPTYSPDRHAIYRGGKLADELAALHEWIDRKPRNYEPSFGSYASA
jgi:hypothetical protein